MSKDRDWVDYANLAANVTQAVQLHGLKQAAEENQRLAQSREQRENLLLLQEQAESELREFVVQIEERLQDIEARLPSRPIGAFVMAKLVQQVVEKRGATTEGFSKFVDKDRMRLMLRSLAATGERTVRALTPSQKADGERCLRYIAEHPQLKELAEVLKSDQAADQIHEECSAAEGELQQAETKLASYQRRSGWASFWLVVTVVFGMAAVIVVLAALQVLDQIRSPLHLILPVVLAGVAGGVYASVDRPRNQNRRYWEDETNKLHARIAQLRERLQGAQPDANRSQNLRAMFGQGLSLEQCQRMLSERDHEVRTLMEGEE